MNRVLRILCLLLAFGPVNASLQAGLLENIAGYFRKSGPALPPTIKVLIVHDSQGVILEVKGKYKIFDPHTGDHISTRFTGKRRFIQAVRDGIKWGEEFPGVYQLMIVPDEAKTTTIVDGVEYRGPIFIYDIGGTISIVNQVYIEDYLSSILANRYQELPDELMAAAAISARSAAYYRVENPKSQYWSVDGTKTGYQGIAAVNQGSDSEKAIKATRYMVMSRSSPNEEHVSAFPAEWKQEGVPTPSLNEYVVSQITLAEAKAMADRGDHAAQILGKAFPGVKIELIHYAPEQVLKARKGQN